MIAYDLSDMEDQQLHNIVAYRNGRTLYEYMVEMPLEHLEAYPQKGWHWWMGRKARSAEALELRDYTLYWRLFALDFRQKYPRKYLQTLPVGEIRSFARKHSQRTPQWAYQEPVRDALRILMEREEPF